MRRSIAVILGIILVIGLLAGCSKKAPGDIGNEVQQDVTAISDNTDLRPTLLYYADHNGYSVPVLRNIPWEEGIGKAALLKLKAGGEDDLKLAALGLVPPVPQDVSFDLDIEGGLATVDILLNGAELEGEYQEEIMLACIVNTLMEFPTVDRVQVYIDGLKVDAMEGGARVLEVYSKLVDNTEPEGIEESNPERFARLFFISASGAFLVPVRRLLGDELSAAGLVEELRTPSSSTDLVSVIPPNVDVLNVDVRDGIATVNMSSELTELGTMPERERMLVTALTNTLLGLDSVDEVAIMVEGREYEPSVQASTSQSFYNILD